MAELMDSPAPGMAAAGAMRSKPPAPGGGGVESITIRKAGNGFTIEKVMAGGAPAGAPENVGSVDEALAIAMTALEGGAPATPAPMGLGAAGPDAMGGAEAESGIPAGPPPERPGVRYDEAPMETPEPDDEKF